MLSRQQVLLCAALLCGGLSICLVSADEQVEVEDNNLVVRGIFSVPQMGVDFWNYCFSRQPPTQSETQNTSESRKDPNTVEANGLFWDFYQWWSAQSQKLVDHLIDATKTPIDPKLLDSVREQCLGLFVLYFMVYYGLRYLTFKTYGTWTVMTHARENNGSHWNIMPSSFVCKTLWDMGQTREIVWIPQGWSGIVLPVVMGLAMYLHVACPVFVVVFMVVMQFVGFKASCWFQRGRELMSMTSCIEMSVQCLTMYARQLVTTSVLEMATACICVAFYAIPILFKEPPRVFAGPFAPPWWDPNPAFMLVNATSVTETWKTVVQEYRKPEAGLFFYFTTAEYLWTLLYFKLFVDALILAEIRFTDVVSSWTGHVIKLKAIIPFVVLRNRVDLFPML